MTIILCKDCEFISGERANNRVRVIKKKKISQPFYARKRS